MPDPGSAVFLSYASQDADAARGICDALRAVGVEVWFDQNELRGGDAWDQRIRRQIKECALFVPIISANTQARREGYFRLEWKLADDRTHLMAKGTPFLVPVCVDDTRDWDALVPDSFMAVQWTRLAVRNAQVSSRVDGPGGEALSGFAARVKNLLEGAAMEPGRLRPVQRDEGFASPPKTVPSRRVIAMALVGASALILAAVVAGWGPWRKSAQAPIAPGGTAPARAAAPSEAVQLTTRARNLATKPGFTREDLALAEDMTRRAVELEPGSAEGWGVRALAQAAYFLRGFTAGEQRQARARDAQSFANRATGLQPDQTDALLALALVQAYAGDQTQAEALFRRALAVAPGDVRPLRWLATLLRYMGRHDEVVPLLEEAARLEPRDPLVRYDLALAYRNRLDIPAARREIEAALALQVFGSPLLLKAWLAAAGGDLATMRAALDQLPLGDRAEDRAVYTAMWAGLLERRFEQVTAAANLTAREYLEDSSFTGPKGLLVGLALHAAGRENLARVEWQACEALLRSRLRDNPRNPADQAYLATVVAGLGRGEEAARIIEPVESIAREQPNLRNARWLAGFYAAVGDPAKAVPYLREAMKSRLSSDVITPATLRLDPRWDKLRGQPEFEALIANSENPFAIAAPQ